MTHRVADLVRPALAIASLSALFGASRSIQSFLRLFLRQDSGEAVVPALVRNLETSELVLSALAWAFIGLGAALAIYLLGTRLLHLEAGSLLGVVARPYRALLLPVALTSSSLLSLPLSPSFPYGLNLVLTLTLEGWFLTLLTLGAFGAALVHALGREVDSLESSVPAESRTRGFGFAVVALAMLCFLLATPKHFFEDGAGQGNMFKYLRMAAAVAGSGTLDIDKAQNNPDPTVREFLGRLPEIARSYVSESTRLWTSVFRRAAEGRFYRGEITASRANRSMFRSAGGGIYYINAPGPGLVLVPAYLLDRNLNRWLGEDRQIAVILFWNLLGALLVYEMIRAAETVAGRAAATVTAFAIALAVPFLFYTFQIYPELPAALLLLFAFRKLVIDPAPGAMGVIAGAFAIAAMPWLHQKYSVVAAVLGVVAAHRLARNERGRVVGSEKLLLLGAPLAVSAYSIFLYNHALTGSLSPTATFRAAGRSSFEPHNVLEGFLGLLFDRENGIFIFAPLYLLALVGAGAFFSRHRGLAAPFVLVAASYLVVIASFPYWPGAVSTMGRYILSILPLLALPMALVVRRAFEDGVLAGAAVTLIAGSLAFSVSFVSDLIPSYQAMLLWTRTLYSDPVQYLPSFLDGGSEARAVHYAKLLALLLAVSSLVYWLRGRMAEERFVGQSRAELYSSRLLVGALALLAGMLGLGALLEHWPGNGPDRFRPEYRESTKLDGGRELFVFGEHGFEGAGVWVPGGGSTSFLLRTPAPVSELTLLLTNGPNPNRVEFKERGRGGIELELPPGGPHRRSFRLRNPYRFEGPGKERYLYRFTMRSEGSFVPAEEGASDDRRRLGTYVRVR